MKHIGAFMFVFFGLASVSSISQSLYGFGLLYMIIMSAIGAAFAV